MSTVGFSLQEPSKSAKRKALLLSKQANAGQKPVRAFYACILIKLRILMHLVHTVGI